MNQTLVNKQNERNTFLIYSVLIVLMLSCATTSIIQLIQRIFPEWNSYYVMFLVIFITCERLLTYSKTQELEFEQKIIYRIAEFVTFAILLKFINYLVHGFSKFLEDVSLWQRDFTSFFTGEYLLVLIMLFTVWLMSGKFAENLEELRIDHLDLNWDVGKLENRRQIARSAMINLILSSGVVMICAAILTRVDIIELFGASPASQIPIVNVLLYFIAAFLFLSQTQFSLLNGRWMWHRVEISVNFNKSWLVTGTIFLLLISFISFLLPTSYTINFLDMIRIIIAVISQIVIFVISLLLLPIGWLFSLLSGSKTETEPVKPPDFSSLASPPANNAIHPLLAFLQSIFFWIIFLGVIAVSFSIYFRQNNINLSTFMRINLFRWIWIWFSPLFGWMNQQRKSFARSVNELESKIRKRLRFQKLNNSEIDLPLLNRSPRQIVIRGFIRLIDSGKGIGIHRQPNQTAQQFSDSLEESLPEMAEEIEGITDTFHQARYSLREISPSVSSAFTTLRKKILSSLEKLKSSS